MATVPPLTTRCAARATRATRTVSVTLTGVRFGSAAGEYDTVADLFGGSDSAQILWATTHGFKEPVSTTTFAGASVQDFDWCRLTSIMGLINLGGGI